MNQTEKTVLVGAGLVALAILGGSTILALQVRKSLRDLDLWKDSGIPAVANDVHNVTSGVGNLIQSWTRA